MRSSIIYKLLFILIVAILGSISALWYANRAVMNAVDGKVFSQISKVPNKSVGLLLGTSQKLSDGRSNLYFSYRIDAAAELMKAGKIKYLIISGDNGNANYDEPTDMKNELIRLGIDSSKLYLDYAGFRTYDSIVRAKEIFGQEDLLIISQKFTTNEPFILPIVWE